MQSNKIEWFIPIRTVSEANIHEHWTKTYKRNKYQRNAIQLIWKSQKPSVVLPCSVTFTRLSMKTLDEEDNLRMAFKSIKDKVADLLIPGLSPGRADGDKRITWKYGQEKTRKLGIKLKIEW